MGCLAPQWGLPECQEQVSGVEFEHQQSQFITVQFQRPRQIDRRHSEEDSNIPSFRERKRETILLWTSERSQLGIDKFNSHRI
jgi:hypothetical protein